MSRNLTFAVLRDKNFARSKESLTSRTIDQSFIDLMAAIGRLAQNLDSHAQGQTLAKGQMGQAFADVMIKLDSLAMIWGIYLDVETVRKFNAMSAAQGSKIKIRED